MGIYQGDSYSFTLFLTREGTSVVNISSCVRSGGNTTYTYVLESGPQLNLGTKIVVTGMSHTENNGTFTINSLGIVTDSLGFYEANTFTVVNAGSTRTEAGTGTVGTTPNVTSTPIIQIIRASDLSAVLISPAAMTALDGTNQLWRYTWSVGVAATGEYIAIVSYSADGSTFSGKPIEKIRVGDAYVTGPVALDGTVAKNSTVAKDATVAKSSDLAAINPNVSTVILAIKAKTDRLPIDPASMALLADTMQFVEDVHDASLASQVVDKTQSPALYTLKRADNSILAVFQLVDNTTESARNRI